MSNSGSSAKGPKVSPARTIVSLVMLVIVGGISVIELRAGLGQYLSGKELKKALGSEEDSTSQNMIKFEAAKALLRMGPSEELVRESEVEKVYRYSWYSLLRPLMGENNPEIYITVSTGTEPIANGFFTSDDESQASNYQYQEPPAGGGGAPPMPLPMPGSGGPGMGRPGGGPPGGGPPGGGMMRPPADNPEGGFGGGGRRVRRPEVEGDSPAGEAEAKPSEGEARPAAEGDKPAAEGDKPAAEGDKPAESDQKPGEGESASGSGDAQPK